MVNEIKIHYCVHIIFLQHADKYGLKAYDAINWIINIGTTFSETPKLSYFGSVGCTGAANCTHQIQSQIFVHCLGYDCHELDLINLYIDIYQRLTFAMQ